MKTKRLSISLLSLLMLTVSPLTTLAASNKEETVKKESTQISSKIDGALQSANNKYQELETLKSEVTSTQANIEKAKSDIVETESSISKRTEMIAGRLKDIQSNGSSFSLVNAVLDAENMSDFINRLYAVSVLQGAEKSKVDSLAADKEKLETLKTDLETNQKTLSTKQSEVESETSALESEVSALKAELADNEDLLNKLATERVTKEAQKKKEAADKVKQEKEAEEARVQAEKQTVASSTQASKTSESSSEMSSTQQNNEVVETPNPTPQTPTEPSNGGGKTLTMEATGYSYSEPGLGFITATGLDLRENPQVIAVDPNVIPLNSLVEVSGYGFAIAADTGGAIKGNRIDLHFKTVQECTNWGRRTVTVTVK